MRSCPQCGKEYADDMNFCLEDGSSLYADSEKTIPFGLNVPRPTNPVGGRTENNGSNQPTEVLPAKKSRFGMIVTAITAVFLLIVGIIGYGLFSAFSAISKTADNSPSAPPSRTPFQPKVLTARTPPLKTDKLKVEVLGNVKAGFDQTFIKCKVTNESESVIKEPRISLMLYKNDLKIGDVSGSTELDYLKPGQSVPIWIGLSNKEEGYTAARPAEEREYETFDKDLNTLYPPLVYTEAKLTSEKLTSLLNFRPYKEIFYEVKGTVENREFDVVNAEIFVIFYGADSEIVGITSTSPPELKKNEKAAFEASMGEKKLFGIPVRFELIAIDDTKK
jgi:hypothetical protein